MRTGNAAGLSFGCFDIISSEKRQICKQVPGIIYFMRLLCYDNADYHECDGLAAQLYCTAASFISGHIPLLLSPQLQINDHLAESVAAFHYSCNFFLSYVPEPLGHG